MYKGLSLIDRYDTIHNVSPMLIIYSSEVAKLMPKAINMLLLGGTALDRMINYETYTLTEQREALQKLLNYATKERTNVNTFDIRMAKLAIMKFMGMERMGINMMEQYKTGSVIVDRNGNEHMVYSYLLSDFEKAMELLQRINAININENMMDKDSEQAMLEIIYLALNCQEKREDIAKYLDVEFAIGAIRKYYDLPVMEL